MQKLDYVKNICFFSDCGDAKKLSEFITAHHGCLAGLQVVSRDADTHVRESMGGDHVYVAYAPFSDRYNVYAWATGDYCIDAPPNASHGFLL
jgi:hypothetical protein